MRITRAAIFPKATVLKEKSTYPVYLFRKDSHLEKSLLFMGGEPGGKEESKNPTRDVENNKVGLKE